MLQIKEAAQAAAPNGIESIAQNRVFVMKLTPETAAYLLAHNYESNRNLRKSKINEFVKLMEDGKWDAYCGDLMRIANDGTLIDGQHRCHAVIAYGKPVEVLCAYGFDESDYSKVDAGSARTGRDALSGMAATVNTAAFIKCVAGVNEMGFIKSAFSSRATIPNSDYPLWVTRIGRENVERYVRRGNLMANYNHGSSAGYALFFAIAEKIDPETCWKFENELSSHLVVNYTIAAFRNRIAKLRDSRARIDGWETFRMCVVSWNAYRNGRELKVFRLPENPVIDGLPEDADIVSLISEKEVAA